MPNAFALLKTNTLRRVTAAITSSAIILTSFAPLAISTNAQAQGMTTQGQFAVSESGAATYSIPIAVPPGVAGMEPRLSLNYNSQGGNGLLGMGWSLGGLSAITRCPQTMAQDGARGGVNYDANDRFCMDGQRLMVVVGTYGAAGSEYRTERESFSRVTYDGNTFKVQTKAGLTMEYGNTADSKIEAQGKTVAKLWIVNKITDIAGNYLTVTYTEDNVNGDFRPDKIDYTGNAGQAPTASVKFEYEGRPDIVPMYQAGSVNKTMQRLAKVKTYVGTTQVKEYRLAYAAQTGAIDRSKLTTVTECDGGGVCLPGVVMTWPNADADFSVPIFSNPILPPTIDGKAPYNSTPAYMQIADFNGDGKMDYMWMPNGETRWLVAYSTGNGFTTPNWSSPALTTTSDGKAAYNVTTAYMRFADFNGDGMTDYMWMPNGETRWLVAYSTGIGFTAPTWANPALKETIEGKSAYNSNPIYMQFSDFNGDGKVDYMWMPNGETRWLVAYSTGTGFTQPSFSLPSIPSTIGAYPSYSNSALYMRWGDFNGDGMTDYMWVPYGATYWNIAYSTGIGFNIIQQVIPSSVGGYQPLSNRDIYMSWGDFNGDGQLDYMYIPLGTTYWNIAYSTGSSFNIVQQVIPATVAGYQPLSDQSIYMRWGDFNGDGMLDYMYVPYGANYWNLAYSTGTGFAVSQQVMPSNIGGYLPYSNVDRYMKLGDFNGDGKMDYMYVPYGARYWNTAYSTGSGFLIIRQVIPADIGNYSAYSTDDQYMIWADFNGDGKQDYMFMPIGQTRWLMAYAQKPSDLINTITASTATSIAYKPLTNNDVYAKDSASTAAAWPVVDLQMPLQTVSNVQTSNGISGTNTVDYQYGGLKAEMGTGRGMLGFRWMKFKELATGIETYTEFLQSWPYTGMAAKSETRLSSGVGGNAGLLKQTTATPACKIPMTGAACVNAANALYFTYTASTTEQSWDLSGAAFPSTTTAFEYNINSGDSQLWGDPTKITVSNSGGAVKTTVNEYLPANTASPNWILGRLKKATVTSTAPETAVSGSGAGSGSGTGGTGTNSGTSVSSISDIIMILLDDD